MLKNKKNKFLLKILVGGIILTPTFSNFAHAEEKEKVFSFDANVAKAEANVNSEEIKNEEPLITEDAKKQEKINNNISAPIQQTNNSRGQSSVSSAVTPTPPSTATGKIVSDAKDENNNSVNNKKQREFIEFTTSNGKKMYLIIDRADKGKEVKLVTEVSPQDLASMIDTTKTQKQQSTQEPPKTPPIKEVKKKNDGFSIFVYIFGIALILSIGFVLYAGFKKRQKKGQEELEEFEEVDEEEKR